MTTSQPSRSPVQDVDQEVPAVGDVGEFRTGLDLARDLWFPGLEAFDNEVVDAFFDRAYEPESRRPNLT